VKIVLAGYNVDREALDEVLRAFPGRLDLTPETLSAAYARISRDPRPADELRRAARREVEKARRSNAAIIFKMGHHSVAEHAVFNFDLMGISRLAIEEIEKFRLCSFTEKSQRYIKLGDDYVVPEEIVRAGRGDLFVETVRAQNAAYHDLYRKLRPLFFETHPALAADPKHHSLLDGWAKEDARYAVSLATEGQIGLTINARNLELMIRRLAAKPSAEIRAIGLHLAGEAARVAPSIVRYTEATAYDAETEEAFRDEAVQSLGSRPSAAAGRSRRRGPVSSAVRLAEATPGGDERVLAALLHASWGGSFARCLREARRLPVRKKKALFLRVFERMEFYDLPPRAFEHAGLTFELTVSASCYAQLKRHRMATLTAQAYDPGLGVTVPPSIEAAGEAPRFRDIIGRTEAAYRILEEAAGPAAAYVLTNAHRRRVLLALNLRELTHLARLREDASAQWDIRRLAAEMSAAARARFPLAAMLLCGKDAYPDVYAKIFGRPPDKTPPSSLKNG